MMNSRFEKAPWLFEKLQFAYQPIGRECERFVKSPDLVRDFVRSFVPVKLSEKTYVFKPITTFDEKEKLGVVVSFANSDQMSALVFLIRYSHPLDFDRVKTEFVSACISMETLSMQYAKNGEKKAFWGC